MQKLTKTLLITTALMAFNGTANANVLTSIKPLGFIASSLTDGVTETHIIVPTGASPHDYNLKPTDVKKMKSADLLLWIGKDVDSFLRKNIQQIDPKKVLTIAEIVGIQDLLGTVEHYNHDAHEHSHEHSHDHKHEHQHPHSHDDHEYSEKEELGINWHIWYSPQISQLIAEKLAQKLTEIYPEQQGKIAENLAEFNRTLAEKSVQITTNLANFSEKGFYVFHDAYGYFNETYGLKQTGAFTINPIVTPGAKTIAKIKQEIQEHKVTCLFAEPQFTPKVINTLSQATGVKVGRLDPMGDSIALGKHSYVDFLQFTADSYGDCLK